MSQNSMGKNIQSEQDDTEKEAVEATKKLIEEQRDILSRSPLGKIILQAMEKSVQDDS